MKVKIEGKRPGKVFKEIKGLSLYTNDGKYLGRIGLSEHWDRVYVAVDCEVSVDISDGFKYGPDKQGKWVDFEKESA